MYIDLLIPHTQDLSYKMSALVEHRLLPGHHTPANGLLDPGVVYCQLLRRVWADKIRATVAGPPYRDTTSTAQRDDHCGLGTISLPASERKIEYRLVGHSDRRAHRVGDSSVCQRTGRGPSPF